MRNSFKSMKLKWKIKFKKTLTNIPQDIENRHFGTINLKNYIKRLVEPKKIFADVQICKKTRRSLKDIYKAKQADFDKTYRKLK